MHAGAALTLGTITSVQMQQCKHSQEEYVIEESVHSVLSLVGSELSQKLTNPGHIYKRLHLLL